MRGYRYTFLDLKGLTGADLTLHSSSDDEARKLASELLYKCEFVALEMRRGAELIYSISKMDGVQRIGDEKSEPLPR